MTTYTAANITQLNADIAAANAAGANSGAELIKLGANIALGTALKPINLAAGVSLEIDGGGHVLSGGQSERGLFVYFGSVDVRNLTIENMRAQGGEGISGGGGGAGLGGGLFVANDPNGPGPAKVTLTNVVFKSNSARGGDGGLRLPSDTSPGPGGGMSIAGLPNGFGRGRSTAVDGFGHGGVGNGGNGYRSSQFGGFGGGAGGHTSNLGSLGYAVQSGSGGLGAGADIFVMQGALLTINGGQVGVGTVVGGSGGLVSDISPDGYVTVVPPGFGEGSAPALGSGIFLQGDETITLGAGQTAGQTTVITGVIADEFGDGNGIGYGEGSLDIAGHGVVDLASLADPSAFSGGVAVQGGTLELGSPFGAGFGNIAFASGPAAKTVEFGASAAPPNVITGFGVDDEIVIDGFDATSKTYADNSLYLSDGAATIPLAINDPGSQGAKDFSLTFDSAADKTVIQSVPHTFTANNIADLNSDIAVANAASANSGAELITLGGDIALDGTALNPINLAAGVSLEIDGGGHVLNGDRNERGLFVYSGSVDVRNLTIENMVAEGGHGLSGGGGGAGLGGGLFVANDPNGPGPAKVTLSNVAFKSDAARGGAGGAQVTNASSPNGGGMSIAGLPNGFGKGASTAAAGFGHGGVGDGHTGQPGNKGGFGGGGGGGGRGSQYFGPTPDGGVGSVTLPPGAGGAGGFGAGAGGSNNGAGGGGLGAGADVFVMAGASLTIEGGQVGVGTVAGGGGANPGSAFGSGIFLQGDETMTLGAGQTAGQTTVITGVIADEHGSVASDPNKGALDIAGQGVVDLAADNTFSGGVTVQGGTLELDASGAAGGGGIVMDAGSTLAFEADGLTVANAISIAGDPGFDVATGQTETISGVISDAMGGPAGVVEKTGGGTLKLTADNSYSGGTVLSAGTLELGNAQAAGSGAIDLTGNGVTLLLDAAQTLPNEIDGFSGSDVIKVTGFGAGDTMSKSGQSVTIHGAQGQTETFSFGPATPMADIAFDPSNDQLTICFLAGTRIRTPHGEVAVETLKRGDPVLTASGEVRPVTWLGRQTVSARFADPLRSYPVRIRAGALEDGVPSRDLMVSPDHALLVGDVLIHAGALVNGSSITRAGVVPETFVYYHVELDDHSLILAESAPAETFVENVERLHFDNWEEYVALYPDGRPISEMPYPRAKSWRQTPLHVRAQLAERASVIAKAVAAA